MNSAIRFLLVAALSGTAMTAIAQNATTLRLDDLVGVWNMSYENGTTGTFTISKNADGTPKILVTTSQGGESAARDIAISGDTIAFARDINVQGQTGSVNYTAKLVDGKLEGSGLVNIGAAGGAAPGGAAPAGGAPGGGAGGGATPFTATKAE